MAAELGSFRYGRPDQEEWEIDPMYGVWIHKGAKLGEGCHFERNVIIDKGVVLGNGVWVGNNVRIDARANIGDGVRILDGVCIYPDTQIGKHTRVLEYVHLGRAPEIAGQITRQLRADYPPLIIGDHCLIGPSAKLYRGVFIGENTSVYEFVTIREECRIGRGVVLAPGVTVNYATSIGDRVRVMHSTHLTGGMVIEDDVFISLHVGSTNDRMIEGANGEGRQWRGATIKRGAVIGAGVMLAPGVEIGEGAHIAMQSVVLRDVPPFATAAGVPARVIRQ